MTLAFWLGGELGRDGALVFTTSEGWRLAAAAAVLLVIGVGQIGSRPLLARLAELALTCVAGALACA